MDSIKSQLMDMGFHEEKVKRAIESCPGAQTLEQVMEWLIAHEGELTSSESPKSRNNVAPEDKSAAGSSSENSEETAATMAARRKITVEEAQRLIKERQVKRAEEDRKKAIEDEKRRRLDGRKMAETRAELQDQERIRLAQQIRREKLEKEQYKKQLLDQIAQDREAMKLRSKANYKPAETNQVPALSATKSPTRTAATECRLALRFPDGSSKVQNFSPSEQLSSVRLFVQSDKKTATDIEFIAPPNRKLTESSMQDTLESLNLCPASRLEVNYKETPWSDMD